MANIETCERSNVLQLPRVDQTIQHFSRKINSVGDARSHEEVARSLLEDLRAGVISVSSLMGPLYGETNLSASIQLSSGGQNPLPSAPGVSFEPKDEFNTILDSNVHPPGYINPDPIEEYDLVVIGAGVSGLLSVITGKWLGKKCALIERHSMGGDCLNIGCVPSKAIISAANAFRKVKEVSQFGISLPAGVATIDFGFVMKRMRKIRAEISHHDSVSRYAREFCEHVFVGQGEFAPRGGEGGDKVVTVTGDDGSKRQLRYKKAMIATGASAFIPSFLEGIPHLTNANFFNLTALPPRMVVIGSGPIGLELAQAMAVFGCEVTCLERGPQILSKEDPDAAKALTEKLKKDGVRVRCHTSVMSVCITNDSTADSGGSSEYSLFDGKFPEYAVTLRDSSTGEEEVVHCEAVLNATGRVPNIFNLGLEHVGVEFDNRRGVIINDQFKTANDDIYSCGDCSTVFQFTHAADFQARLAIRNMFLGDVNRLSDLLIPWCTYTYPEIAHVGKYEAELDATGVEYETYVRQLAPVDRCLCDGVDVGFVKLTVLAGSDKIIGATICAEHAGDMISEVTVCMQHGIGIAEVAGTIHPYPTTQEAIRQCALGFYKHYKDPAGLPLATLKLRMAEVEQLEKQAAS